MVRLYYDKLFNGNCYFCNNLVTILVTTIIFMTIVKFFDKLYMTGSLIILLFYLS